MTDREWLEKLIKDLWSRYFSVTYHMSKEINNRNKLINNIETIIKDENAFPYDKLSDIWNLIKEWKQNE